MKMKKSFYLIPLFIWAIFSCKEEVSKVQEVSYDVFSDTIPKKKNRLKTFKLKKSIQKKINEYESFTFTKAYIDTLNKASYSILNNTIYSLNEELEELPKELDSTLKTKGVLSRIIQIETYGKAINFEFSKQHKDTVKINSHTIKLLESYNHLITQLNETSAKLPEELKKQL